MKTALTVLLACLLVSCSSAPERAKSPELPRPVDTVLRVASEPPSHALNIGIRVFEAN
jgi:starvation-inducible outer membrane lipoprotein